MKALFSIIIACGMLGGCSTPTSLIQAITVPEKNVISRLHVTSTTPARLTIIRDTHHLPSDRFYFSVGKITLVSIGSGEKYTTLVEPGAVFLTYSAKSFANATKSAQIETIFHPSKHYVYRLEMDQNEALFIKRDLELSE